MSIVRRPYLLLGCVGGLITLLINNLLIGEKLAFAQMALCSLLVFGIVGIQANKSLYRSKQFGVALALLAMHFAALTQLTKYFPLTNMFIGFVGVGIESVILMFLYVRIGQSVDPEGPYGLTDEEIRQRGKK